MASDEKDSTNQLKNENITEDIKDNTDIMDATTSEKQEAVSEEEKATPSKGKRLLDSLTPGKVISEEDDKGRTMRKKPRVDYDENKKQDTNVKGSEQNVKAEDDDDEIQEVTPSEVKAKLTTTGEPEVKETPFPGYNNITSKPLYSF